MQSGVEEINNENTNIEENNNGPKIIQTDIDNHDGQNKCPKCGSTEISLNVTTGKLKCHYCRFEFDPINIDDKEEDLHNLKGEVYGSGATNIQNDASDMLTFKCSSCGAEVVVDTANAPQARCHWCRNTLSVNQQIPNGAIPDMVLPFKITKEEAQKCIEEFVKKRQTFAHPKFKAEFTTNNIMGVYLPYMVVDVNGHSTLSGQGEHLVRKYSVGTGNDRKTYYDADLYDVDRSFDILIDDLTIESSSDKLKNNSKSKTNNVINAIMPFDTENCVKWDANYLKGYTSEKRDTNIDDLKNIVQIQSKDIARYNANKTITEYDRGVRWDREDLQIKGEKWKASYLPVWLYSYQESKSNGEKLLHYVAVNARTKETMGSVPIHMPKLMIASLIAEFVGILGYIFIDFDFSFVFLFTGIAYFLINYAKYRNNNAKHKHEAETKATIENITKGDHLVEHRKKLSNSHMSGANNDRVQGSTVGPNVLDVLNGKSGLDNYVRGKMEDYQAQENQKNSNNS